MEKGIVYHRNTDQYCYPINKDELCLQVRVPKNVEEVFLIYDDPFVFGILGGENKWEGRYREKITDYVELKEAKIGRVIVRPEYKRLRYYFVIKCEGQTYYLYEDGIFTKEENKKYEDHRTYMYAWMNEVDIIKEVPWIQKTVWYQIFPERFANGDSSLDQEWFSSWEQKGVTNEKFYGGDLEGIIDKLDYLEELGITGLYLTPIFKAGSSHKYDTIDYYEVDKYFGNKEVLKRLVKLAHQKNMKVMLDGVFNHSSNEFFAWKDVLKNKEKSKYKDWYMVFDYNKLENLENTKDKSYYSFAFEKNMPKLNTSNEEVQKYFIDVVKYWIEQCDIDGFRLDVANEVSHDFLKRIRREVKALKEDFYLLGEIWYDSIAWLRGDEMDSVMNYPIVEGLNKFIHNEEISKKELEYSMNRIYSLYTDQTNNMLFNMLDSHDTPRVFNQLKNKDKVIQSLAFLLTQQGTPCLYYGTEIMLDGKHDPDNRRPMPWEEIKNNKIEKKMIMELIQINKQYRAVINSQVIWTANYQYKRLVEYMKKSDDIEIRVYLNYTKEAVQITRKDKEVLFSNRYEDNILQPNGTLILKELY